MAHPIPGWIGGLNQERHSRVQARRHERGQAFAELALLLPVMALLFTGLSDISRAQHARLTIAAAAHAGVLYGTQNLASAKDEAGIRQRVLAELEASEPTAGSQDNSGNGRTTDGSTGVGSGTGSSSTNGWGNDTTKREAANHPADIKVELSEADADGFGKQEISVTVTLPVSSFLHIPGLRSTYLISERASGRVLSNVTGS